MLNSTGFLLCTRLQEKKNYANTQCQILQASFNLRFHVVDHDGLPDDEDEGRVEHCGDDAEAVVGDVEGQEGAQHGRNSRQAKTHDSTYLWERLTSTQVLMRQGSVST